MSRRISAAKVAPLASPATRRTLPVAVQRVIGCLAFGSVAAACWALGVLPLVACARALASGATLVVVHPREAVTVPLCAAFSLLAAMCALPDTQIRLRPSRRSPTARRADRIATVLFAGAALSMLVVPFAAPLASFGFSRAAAERAYVACPPPAWNRYRALRWGRDADACPNDR